MKTRALRLYGKQDLRLDEFELPPLRDDEILARVITDSVCMSTYKTVLQGSEHRRVPKDIAKNPIIVGHECCGEILAVGKKWQAKYKAGGRFAIQPTLNYQGSPFGPGYSYRFVGGNATYIVIPNEVMEMDCLLNFKGDAYFKGSLAEPLSSIVAACKASYHTVEGSYRHEMGIKPKGNMIILNGSGPMGFLAVDYAIHAERKPELLVVTGTNEAKLSRARRYNSVKKAAEHGITLVYANTGQVGDVKKHLLELTAGQGYDDVFVYAPLKESAELGGALLGKDGCLNFFAGPTDKSFTAELNYYDIHYRGTHVVGTSGGYPEDMKEALALIEEGLINPATIVTHIGGLNSAKDTILNLPAIDGGKKLIYSGIDLELTPLSAFAELGKSQPLFRGLQAILERNDDLWCAEAEAYLLQHALAGLRERK
ncbi:zinc-binding dehydrogenase [Propionispora hippei]|uniref:Threonine dehydrogenase n=1 Tax=Propionispora hippei DSM 15287 TaxID=1123003 RepID=A0A1M6EKW4_9FIRM|nr:zinc-binding dehydrogenase [Propionispora hippei]SHI86141.1 Threonine dehydrogenase [Propionispora hippei DSM 15287]